MSLCLRAKFVPVGARAAPLGASVSKRDKGTSLGTQGDRLELLKKGTGGRSSFNGIIATVFGNSGFLGRYVCNELGKCGTMMVLPYRGDFYDVQRLKVCGDLGQVLFHQFSIKDEQSVARAMKYSNVVINMIGKDVETSNFSFKDVHVDGARTIARLARENGVNKLIHFSALNAQEKPPSLVLGHSKFYASKWEGEQAVREEFPGAIVFRPADMYGHEDRFLRYYANKWRRTFHLLPIWGRGNGVTKCPVYVADVAKAVLKAILEKGNDGEIYQAVGPKQYDLGELVDFMFRVMRRGPDSGYIRYDMRLDPWFIARVMVIEKLLKYPPMSIERLRREITSDQIDWNLRQIADLGVALTDAEERLPYELKYWRATAYFDPDVMQFERVRPPPSQLI